MTPAQSLLIVRSVARIAGGGGAVPVPSAYDTLVGGAVAHYNGLGDSPADASGNGNDGVWTGTPTYSDPPTGIPARAFTTSSGNYISLPGSLNGATAWTVAGWIRATSLANYASPFAGTLAVTSWPMVRYVASNQKLQMNAFDGTVYIVNNMTSSATITTATWYHLAMQYDGTIAKLWLDGVDVGSGSGSIQAGKALVSDTPRIGGGQNTSAAAWVGEVSDLVLFNRFLSPVELATLIAGT